MSTIACYLNSMGILCSIGTSAEEVKRSLLRRETCLTYSDAYTPGNSLPLGIYDGELPDISSMDKAWRSRNNQFAMLVIDQIMDDIDRVLERYGKDRVGVIIGTSTSGIGDSEPAIRQWVNSSVIPPWFDYRLQEMGATAQFVAMMLGVRGPVYGISTACSSGAKALASARRLIRAGICDAVITGGVDTLCGLTVQGFSSLEAVSDSPCNPFSKNRKGINIGEGAAVFVITTEQAHVELAGTGESSDAHHMSAPDPAGTGARRCMQAALDDAGINASDVGYVNLHGTATALNDQMESRAVSEIFDSDTLCSSTKPFTGHTLGAAGAIEAAICWLMLMDDSNLLLPDHIWDGVVDDEIPELNLVGPEDKINSPLRYVLSNSFAFGGNNISLLLGSVE